jgi:hypothetical protein
MNQPSISFLRQGFLSMGTSRHMLATHYSFLARLSPLFYNGPHVYLCPSDARIHGAHDACNRSRWLSEYETSEHGRMSNGLSHSGNGEIIAAHFTTSTVKRTLMSIHSGLRPVHEVALKFNPQDRGSTHRVGDLRTNGC